MCRNNSRVCFDTTLKCALNNKGIQINPVFFFPHRRHRENTVDNNSRQKDTVQVPVVQV